MNGKKAVLYILPEYAAPTASHLYHIYQLLELLSRDFRIFLVVERGEKPAAGPWASVTLLPGHGHFLLLRRAVAEAVAAIKARLSGCRMVYTHYSFYGGIIVAGIFRCTGGNALYWSCGLMASYRRPWSWRPAALIHKCRHDFPLWLTLRINTCLVTGTAGVARHYAESYHIPETKICIVPNWVDCRRFDPTLFNRDKIREELDLPPSAAVVLYVHRMALRKGCDRLAPFMQCLRIRMPDAVCLAIGDGPLLDELKMEIRRQGLDNAFRVMGSVANNSLPPYFSAADLFVLPSREEGFPRVLLEAMSMAVPFIATDVGGVREITTPLQAPCIVTEFTPEAFAERAAAVLCDASLAQTLREEGLRQARRFSLEKAVDRFTELWNSFF